jgi:hypothetical protein
MDFVLGAEEMTKKIDEDAGYKLVYLEFANSKGKPLTLVRHLTGGDVSVHYSTIDKIEGDGTAVAWKRHGKSTNPYVSSVFLPFAGMKEARLILTHVLLDRWRMRETVEALSLEKRDAVISPSC